MSTFPILGDWGDKNRVHLLFFFPLNLEFLLFSLFFSFTCSCRFKFEPWVNERYFLLFFNISTTTTDRTTLRGKSNSSHHLDLRYRVSIGLKGGQRKQREQKGTNLCFCFCYIPIYFVLVLNHFFSLQASKWWRPRVIKRFMKKPLCDLNNISPNFFQIITTPSKEVWSHPKIGV